MPKAVFRPNELISVTEKVVIDSPTSFAELAHFAPVEEIAEELNEVEEYKGPTADDLRREAEFFKIQWEEEKERMITSARAQAESIINDAQQSALAEVTRKNDEGQIIKQQAEIEAQRIISEANSQAAEILNTGRLTLDTERRDSRTQGLDEGHKEGYAEGKAEVDRLIERTHVVLERAQQKRGDILSETEKEVVDLVLLVARKVVKVISENQREVIITNVVEALRKVKSKGDIIIRVNLADLQLATEHKQDFINMMEGAKSVHISEDSTVDKGGCIIETDFGEIDARISSQLAEMESKILEISPIRQNVKDNTPVPIVRTANLNADLLASAGLLNAPNIPVPFPIRQPEAAPAKSSSDPEAASVQEEIDEELSAGVNAALTASAAMAALATIATKGKRESDKKIKEKLEQIGLSKRKTD